MLWPAITFGEYAISHKIRWSCGTTLSTHSAATPSASAVMTFTPANMQILKPNESFLPLWYFRSCYLVTSLCNNQYQQNICIKKCKHFLTIDGFVLYQRFWSCRFFYIVFFFTLQVALDIYIEQMQQEIEEDTQLHILIINTSYSDFIGVVYR